MRAGTWGGKSYVNPPMLLAIFRTSSKEDPERTKTVCLYGGRTLETSSVTLMTAGVGTDEGASTAGTMTTPGRKEEADVTGILFPMVTTAHVAHGLAFPRNGSGNTMNTCSAENRLLSQPLSLQSP